MGWASRHPQSCFPPGSHRLVTPWQTSSQSSVFGDPFLLKGCLRVPFRRPHSCWRLSWGRNWRREGSADMFLSGKKMCGHSWEARNGPCFPTAARLCYPIEWEQTDCFYCKHRYRERPRLPTQETVILGCTRIFGETEMRWETAEIRDCKPGRQKASPGISSPS